MSFYYRLRSESTRISRLEDPEYTEPEATSSVAAPSSPDVVDLDDFPDTENTPFGHLPLDFFPEEDETDREFLLRGQSTARYTNLEKTLAILAVFRNFSRFSLRTFLETLFKTDDSTINNVVGMFLEGGGAVAIMQLLWDRERHSRRAEDTASWIVERAAGECAKEFSLLTDKASQGPFYSEAKSLRVPCDRMSVSLIRNFSLPELLALYERTTPRFQQVLTAVIGKLGKEDASDGMRNPDDGRTMVTSIVLNLRSRISNFHAAMNTMVLWEQQASKKLVQLLNRTGVCTSYEYQGQAILALSRNSVEVARKAAIDPSKIKMLSYDNFNWRSRAWETSALHGTIQHDQVSAMLVVLHMPAKYTHVPAEHFVSIPRFAARAGQRHKLPAAKALRDILPCVEDRTAFSQAIEVHIAHILSQNTTAFMHFAGTPSNFNDPMAVEPHRTERHFLPTFDQEQGSTRGNMVVLSHYFLKVLRLPSSVFEHIMYFVTGDRLTTVRDRAAQDQRAVDRSPFRIDHLSSFAMGSGLMHQCLNMIINLARNFWGGAVKDPVSFLSLRDLLPNRSDVNLSKVDFYSWLRFLDVILRALTIAAAYSILKVDNAIDLAALTTAYTPADFGQLCRRITHSLVVPSVHRLEDDGYKTTPGETTSGHAVLLMHDLMSMREMRHAIKHGHPGRVHRMLKFWMPMFYAGGSYNYAHEDMELLHNLTHDWPSDTAEVVLGGLLVNTTGKPDGFLEADIDIEHLNKNIKGRAHGSNATPALLEKVTPALGEAQSLTRQMCTDLGLDNLNQRHSKVPSATWPKLYTSR